MFDLSKSPIRKNISYLQPGQLSIFEDDSLDGNDIEGTHKLQVRTILKDTENMLGTMESNRDKPIKIAVMGEVKAGKSTFINVCVGKEIAYTDVLEATAIVSEITYSENEYAKLIDIHGNTVQNFSFDDMLIWSEEMIDHGEDFSNYGGIEIGICNELFKNLVFVDTPGLLSITSENHDVTNDYIAQADYILWVINSRNLGSKSVNDFIDKIKLSGKPLIGIINKVDSEDDLKEIKNYVENEYHNIFEEIFYVSAANAWSLLRSGDPNWKQTTGFEAVLDCVEDLSEDKDYSSIKTQYYQLQREREVHLKIQSTIFARKKYYDNELATFWDISKRMKAAIKEELTQWVETELYMDEKAQLLNADESKFDYLIEQFSSSSYFTDIIDNKYKEISYKIYEQWDMIGNELVSSSSQVLIDFKYHRPINSNETNPDTTIYNSTENVKKGMKNGAIMAIAFAGYSAWLGPAATAITFVDALVPCLIPLTIGGALLERALNDGKRTREIVNLAERNRALTDDLYNRIIEAAKKEMRQIESSLVECVNHYYNERCDFYKEKTKALNFDFTEPQYGNFINSLESYLQKLNDAIESLEKDVIIPPPSMEGLE